MNVNVTFELTKYVSCNNVINNFTAKNITEKIAYFFLKWLRRLSLPTSSNIQGDSEGNVNILEGDVIPREIKGHVNSV